MPARRRIMLAGASDADNESFKRLLSALDCELQAVTEGANVWESVQSFNPHLILLDSTVNGCELCQQIKGDSSTSGTMILMVSTLNELGDIDRAVDAGIDDFISKPVIQDELLKRVQNLLKLHDHWQG